MIRKKSRQREAILRLLMSTKVHPTAEWLHTRLKEEFPGIGLATVYRNLKLLKESGQVLELLYNDGVAHYDGDVSRHYHFYCDGCGKIIDIPGPPNHHVESSLAREYGIKVTRFNMVLGGLCQECQVREAAGPGQPANEI